MKSGKLLDVIFGILFKNQVAQIEMGKMEKFDL